MEETEALKKLEQILQKTTPKSLDAVFAQDFRGKDLLKEGYYEDAFWDKAEAGRDFELYAKTYLAAWCFDRAGQAAYHLEWPRVRLKVNLRALANYEDANQKKDVAFCMVRLAECYWNLGDVEKFEQYLDEAEERFARVDFNPQKFGLYVQLDKKRN